ncbi:MAG: Histidine-tRNA ligase, partial [Candidatus Beckwithbacteria bacterium GW2011_GWA2_43_10]
YREFTQCDIDIFGSPSPLADAEIIACTYFAFKNVGFSKIILRLNDRQTLFTSLKPFTSQKIEVLSIIQTIDKLDKKAEAEVVRELIDKGMSTDHAKKALLAVSAAKPTKNLKQIMTLSQQLGVPGKALEFSPNLARGLDYYTGMIFEVVLPEDKSSSFGGGGRYDNLIGKLSGIDMPAVGIAFGFDRMVEAAEKLNLIPVENSGVKTLVTCFDAASLPQALTAASRLREKNISAEIYPAVEKLDKQLKYADKKGVPYVLIIGPDETAKSLVTLKDMKTGKQETLTLEKAINVLKA